MQQNIFLLSDASYSKQSTITGIAVFDSFKKEKHTYTCTNINSANEAEYKALLYSIKIAIENKYDNVIFVYDCISLDLTKIKLFVKSKFKHSQFLWTKREYLENVDSFAKEIRIKQENIKIPVLEKFKELDDTKIFKICLLIANKREKEIINGYINNTPITLYTKDNKLIGIQNSKGYEFFKFIYQNLNSNKKIHFINYLAYINPLLPKNTFKKKLSNAIQLKFIENILEQIKLQKGQNK